MPNLIIALVVIVPSILFISAIYFTDKYFNKRALAQDSRDKNWMEVISIMQATLANHGRSIDAHLGIFKEYNRDLRNLESKINILEVKTSPVRGSQTRLERIELIHREGPPKKYKSGSQPLIPTKPNVADAVIDKLRGVNQ